MSGRDFPVWSEATWSERVGISFSWVAAIVIAACMFAAGLFVLGSTLDGIARINTEHDACLRRATNGYEIKQCR